MKNVRNCLVFQHREDEDGSAVPAMFNVEDLRMTDGKNLVIVESPAKAGTIQKFLGNDFIVKSSFGHIRDL